MTLPELDHLLEMTVDIVTSMVTNNSVSPEQLPSLIGSVHAALSGLGQVVEAEQNATGPERAVPVRKSLADPEVIISMIDGKPYKTLTRHIGLHGYNADSYRSAFGLKRDYPMVAEAYTARRRDIAKKIGLGRKKLPHAAVTPAIEVPVTTPTDELQAAPAKQRRRKVNEGAS